MFRKFIQFAFAWDIILKFYHYTTFYRYDSFIIFLLEKKNCDRNSILCVEKHCTAQKANISLVIKQKNTHYFYEQFISYFFYAFRFNLTKFYLNNTLTFKRLNLNLNVLFSIIHYPPPKK